MITFGQLVAWDQALPWGKKDQKEKSDCEQGSGKE